MKYRIWHEPTQQFVRSRVDDNGYETNYFIYPSANGELVCEDIDGGSLLVSDHEDYEVMYCSGLKDSRGDEIYDGDILRVEFDEYSIFQLEVRYGKYKLEEKYDDFKYYIRILGWYLKHLDSDRCLSLLAMVANSKKVSIIGTRYNQK